MTIAAFMLAAAQAPLGSTMIAVALPSLSVAVGASLASATGLLATSYLIASIAGQSPGGKLGDVVGHARAIWAGMLVYATGAAIGLVAQGLAVLTLSRVAMALGGALVFPASLAMLRLHLPAERQGRVFGLFGAVMSLAASIGPPLGGEILARFGWRAVFLAHLPPLALAAILAWRFPAPSGGGKQRFIQFAAEFDWPGALLLVLTLGLLVWASKASGLDKVLALIATLLVAVWFVLHELRAASPVLDPRLFLYPDFRAASSITMLLNFSMYGLLFELPQYFQEVRGASAADSGRALFVMMFAMFVAAPFGGRLTDRFGSRRAAFISVLPQFAGMLWLQAIGHMQAPMDAAWAVGLLGVGMGLMNSPAQTAALAGIPREKAGMAAGANSTMRYLGGTLSVLLLSTVLGGVGGQSGSTHEFAVHCFGLGTVLVAAVTFALPSR